MHPLFLPVLAPGNKITGGQPLGLVQARLTLLYITLFTGSDLGNLTTWQIVAVGVAVSSRSPDSSQSHGGIYNW